MEILKVIIACFLVATPTMVFGQNPNLLSPEEVFWLESRNNTIIVYPEKNNPPFSYQSAGGNIQGLAIDYIELIAKKVGARIVYLTPQSHEQVLSDFKAGKGDVLVNFIESDSRKNEFIITDSYITVPVVIVVRKDVENRRNLTLEDYMGKRVSVVAGTAFEQYIDTKYPSVIIESVADDEVGLQKVVLGEVDALVMDVVSLSYYSSRQVLSSVKIVGYTDIENKLSFAIHNDEKELQSILEKGQSQINPDDRILLTNKWMTISSEVRNTSAIYNAVEDNLTIITSLLLGILVLVTLVTLLIRRKHSGTKYFKRLEAIDKLRREVDELEGASDMLSKELKMIRKEEDKLEEKLDELTRE